MNISVQNLYSKKEILFDGVEHNYMHFIYHYLCPICSGQIMIKPAKSKTFYISNEEDRNKLVNIIKGLTVKDTPVYSPYYTYKGLGLTQDIQICGNKHKFLIITANGEFQPGRYMVVNLGMFEL